LTTLTRRLLDLRRQHPVLRQRHFFVGRSVVEGGRKDLTWVHPLGREMTASDWHDPHLVTIGLFLAGDAIRARGPEGEAIKDQSFLLWLHAGGQDLPVLLPDVSPTYAEVLRTDRLDQLDRADEQAPPRHDAGQRLVLTARSVLLLSAR
ncbi:MAG: glycogen debranching protein GlgX, partial [Nocardioidaceae bacterium]